MITKNLAKALEEIGFEYAETKTGDGSHVYAIYDGYLVTAYEKNSKKIVYFNFRFPENEANALKKYNMSDIFAAMMDEYSITDYSFAEDGLRVYSIASVDDFLQLIEKCSDLLTENEIKGIKCCSCCGNSFGSRHPKKVTDGCENHLMCEHCTINAIEECNTRSAKKSEEASEDKIWKGILGSVVGSLIGVLLYFVLYYWVSPAVNSSGLNEIRYIFCACGFLVATLSYYGYRLFCKKVSLSAYVTIPVTAFVCTTVGQYLGVVFEFIAGKNYVSPLSNKSFWLVHLRNTVPEDLAENFVNHSAIFYKLLAISIMFALVGSAIYLLTLREKSTIKPETLTVETISIGK